MEAALGLVLGTVVLLAAAAPFLALVALVRLSRLERRLVQLDARLAALSRRARDLTAPPATAGAETAAPEPVAGLPPRPAREPVVEPAAPAAGHPPGGSAPLPRPAPPRERPSAPAARVPVARLTPPPRKARSADFVTDVGPRILVGAGGLAVVVFLALFVRYAWENNWVGPAGRVLIGSIVSLALVAAGLRLVRGVYRPLGQGLAAAGFAGLYVSAYAAHGFYGLVPRGPSATVMVVVTACAVAVADRLETRLLATLAWIGGYLTPVLLSTGEDRAVSLFAYLALLGGGAIWLDRRRPWPETLPLAFVGTAVLYVGWYASHFRPERFGVAAGGLVLFTGLFALGAAPAKRSAGFAAVLAASAVGLAFLGADAGRPEVLLPLSLVLAGVGLRAVRPLGLGVALAAGLVPILPFVAWAVGHYTPESFGVSAAWLVGGAVLFILGAPAPTPVLPATVLLVGGTASVALAARTDRPLALLILLAAQAGLAWLVHRRWYWAEAAGVTLGALAVFAWFERYFDAGRGDDLLTLGLVLAGVYVVALVVRGLAVGTPLRGPDGVTQVVAAGLAWLVLDHVLGLTRPGLLGPAAVGLAGFHLVLGLAARRRPDQALWARVTLALAALFLTLAIPVQLGLFGITLAWAGEALVLLWLGARHDSLLTRAGGYGVLLLSVGRLLVRHLPLHEGPFTPVLNPVFSTWLLVILAVAAARRITAPARARGAVLDRGAAWVLGPLGLALLFGLVTDETRGFFDQRVRTARVAGQEEAVGVARRQAELALSVLWTVFATGLLASGLALRSRALFYTAYALFGITALKVVMVDLATMPTFYRMLSFLALGVLLLAGAWLNLRFRERLLEPEPRA